MTHFLRAVPLYFAIAITLLSGFAAGENLTITSPDEKIRMTAGPDSAGTFRYTLEADGRKLITPRRWGWKFPVPGKFPEPDGKSRGLLSRNVDEVWKPVWGKRTLVPDRFQETIIDLTQ